MTTLEGNGMADDQRTARLFGVLFIITYLTSIPAALLFQPVLNDPAGYLVAPEFLWELLLGIYAAIWGFRRAAPILSAREE
jgi:peptidoglycan/LPS O-acetylase OafA/YrhL